MYFSYQTNSKCAEYQYIKITCCWFKNGDVIVCITVGGLNSPTVNVVQWATAYSCHC